MSELHVEKINRLIATQDKLERMIYQTNRKVLKMHDTMHMMARQALLVTDYIVGLEAEKRKTNTTVFTIHDPTYKEDLKTNKSITGQWVYFIKGHGVYDKIKIGLTNNMKKRLSTLQTGNHNKLEIVAHIKTHNMKQLETSLHNHFDYCRTAGEWFTLTMDNVGEFLDYYRDTGGFLDLQQETDNKETNSDEELDVEEMNGSEEELDGHKTLKTFYKHIYDTKPSWYLENKFVNFSQIVEAYREYFEDYDTKSMVISRQLNNVLYKKGKRTKQIVTKKLISFDELKLTFLDLCEEADGQTDSE
jgi:hypothetical protein